MQEVTVMVLVVMVVMYCVPWVSVTGHTVVVVYVVRTSVSVVE